MSAVFSHLRCFSTIVLVLLLAHNTSTLHAIEGEAKEIPHAQGVLRVDSVPQRVAVLDLAALDTLNALEIDVIGVPSGSKNWPRYLQKYSDEKYIQIGSLFEPDVEVIKSLKPDLIIVGGRSRSKLTDLNKIAPTIDLSTTTTGFIPSVIQNLLALGAIFDKEELANVKALALLAKVRELQEQASQQGKGVLLFSVGENVSAHAPNTRFGIVYELVGIEPVLPAATRDAGQNRSREDGNRGGRGGERSQPEAGSLNTDAEGERTRRSQASKKALLDAFGKTPDWIFVIDRDSAFKERENSQELISKNDVISQSSAWSRNHVVHLDGAGWYLVGGGYTQLEQTIAQLQNAFSKQ